MKRAREPLKAVLSVLLAVTLADALELDDLSWAAFSGYMVMRADPSVATQRGLMRIAGTLSGAAFGVVLAPVIADQPALLVVSLFIATWIGIFGSLKSRYSYAWVFFGITAGLVMTEAPAAPDNVLHFALQIGGAKPLAEPTVNQTDEAPVYLIAVDERPLTLTAHCAHMAAGLTKDTDGLGAVGAYKALANYTQLGGVLTVFSLPE